MSLALYMDHNVVRAVSDGCRQAGLDVLTAFDDGWHQQSDRSILDRAYSLHRVVFTQDTDFLVLAADRRSNSEPFYGIVFAKHGAVSVQRVVEDLKLICETLTDIEIQNQLIWLPL